MQCKQNKQERKGRKKRAKRVDLRVIDGSPCDCHPSPPAVEPVDDHNTYTSFRQPRTAFPSLRHTLGSRSFFLHLRNFMDTSLQRFPMCLCAVYKTLDVGRTSSVSVILFRCFHWCSVPPKFLAFLAILSRSFF